LAHWLCTITDLCVLVFETNRHLLYAHSLC